MTYNNSNQGQTIDQQKNVEFKKQKFQQNYVFFTDFWWKNVSTGPFSKIGVKQKSGVVERYCTSEPAMN